MAAKTTSSCFTFLKEALILPTRNPKLFTPVLLLLAVTAFLGPLVHVLFVQPLAYDMGSHLLEIGNMDPSSPEYAKILEEIKQDAVKLVLIVIAQLIVALALGFVNQIIAFFAASTTYSGERYSLAELIREISKGNALKGPFITIAMATALNFAWMAVLAALLSVVMRGGGRVISVQGLTFGLGFLAFLYFTVLAVVSIAASVVDEEYHGVGALRQSWRLMTRVRRTEGFVLVLVALLLPTVVTPLYGVALLYAKSMAVALCVLVVYALLSGAQQLFYLAAATVYYYEATVYYYEATAMESKEAAPCDYVKIPSREANV